MAISHERLSVAFAYAAELHKNDIRKGTSIPYVSHLLNVCGLVLIDGGSEDEAIAAILHDSLEDHSDVTSYEEINRRFGPRVAAIVAGCSDTPKDYKGGPKPPWRERKERYIEHLRHTDAGLRRVSQADKLDNARAILADYRRIGDELWGRFSAGGTEQLWYYRSLVETFRAVGSVGPLFDELERTVSEIERLNGIQR